MKKMHAQHDSFFKFLLSHLSIAKAFIKAYLPQSVVKRIDWKNFSLYKFNPESMVGKLFGQRTADMVYTTKLDGQAGYLIAHIEHQSTLTEETYLRAEIYCRLVWLEHRKMHPRQPRPAIVSIVYFNGKENIEKYPICLQDLMPPKPFDKYFLKPLFVNVNAYSDDELAQHSEMAPADLLFKYSMKSKPSIKIISKLFNWLSRYSSSLREDALYYMANQFDTDWETLASEAKKFFDEGEVMTAAQQLEKRGEKRGGEREKEIIALRMLNRGMHENDIKEITGLPINKLQALKKAKKSKKQ